MAEPIHIGAAADVPEGEAIVVPAATAGTRDDVAVFHTDAGEFHAIDDTCTHEDASLFCLRTGEALCLPATKGVGVHRVEEREGQLYLVPGA